jgi:glycosyltransferase involved in cell wall biosynthesis
VRTKPKIVFLDSVAKLSGGELALLRTLPALVPHVEAVVILAEDGPLAPRLRETGADVIILPLDDSVRQVGKDTIKPSGLRIQSLVILAQHVWALRGLLRQLEPDLVHTNSLKSALYGGLAGRLARIPVVWHIRDRIAPDYLPRPAVWLVRLLGRVLPTAVIANSRATLATIQPDASVVSSPVVFDSVVPPARATSASQGDLLVGIIGRISPWKGQDVFLRAFALAFAGTKARAWIVGSPLFGEDAFEAGLHELVSELGIEEQVEFRGFREDVFAEMQALDIAVHASTIPEPFGQVVLEAMAVGTPIIASTEGGPAEIITDGVDGLLVAPGDPARLSQAMRTLADDPQLRGSLAEAARVTAAGYSPERTASGILAVYERVLERSIDR